MAAVLSAKHIFCKEGTLFFIYLLFLHTVSEWILAWFKMRCCFVFVCLSFCFLSIAIDSLFVFRLLFQLFSCFFIIFASVTRHRWFRNYFPSIWCCREFLQLKIWLSAKSLCSVFSKTWRKVRPGNRGKCIKKSLTTMSLPFMSCYVTNLSHFLLELFNSLDSDIIFPSVLSLRNPWSSPP